LDVPQKPDCIIRLDTLGWEAIDEETNAEFEALLQCLQRLGVRILSRKDDPRIEALEQALTDIPNFMLPIFAWRRAGPVGCFGTAGSI
jgi:hypothetical protein